MRLLYADENAKDIVIILSPKENDAMVEIINGYLGGKPNKRSNAYKLASALDDRLLV